MQRIKALLFTLAIVWPCANAIILESWEELGTNLVETQPGVSATDVVTISLPIGTTAERTLQVDYVSGPGGGSVEMQIVNCQEKPSANCLLLSGTHPTPGTAMSGQIRYKFPSPLDITDGGTLAVIRLSLERAIGEESAQVIVDVVDTNGSSGSFGTASPTAPTDYSYSSPDFSSVDFTSVVEINFFTDFTSDQVYEFGPMRLITADAATQCGSTAQPSNVLIPFDPPVGVHLFDVAAVNDDGDVLTYSFGTATASLIQSQYEVDRGILQLTNTPQSTLSDAVMDITIGAHDGDITCQYLVSTNTITQCPDPPPNFVLPPNPDPPAPPLLFPQLVDPEGQTLTYSLASNSEGHSFFTVDNTTHEIQIITTPLPEGAITLTIAVHDTMNVLECPVHIIVERNNPPRCGPPQEFQVSPSTIPANSIVGTMNTATNDESATNNTDLTYSLDTGPATGFPSEFLFNGTTRVFSTAVSPLTVGTSQLFVIVDNGRLSVRCNVTVVVAANTAPECPNVTTFFTTDQTPLDTTIGTWQGATDQDGDIVTYLFSNAASNGHPEEFAVDNSTLQISAGVSPLSPGVTELVLEASDSFDSALCSIVIDVNGVPVCPPPPSLPIVLQASNISTPFTTMPLPTDADLDPLFFILVSPASGIIFNETTREISAETDVNGEAVLRGVIDIEVEVSDSKDVVLCGLRVIINRPPECAASTDRLSVDSGAPIGTTVGSLTEATDAETGAGGLVYRVAPPSPFDLDRSTENPVLVTRVTPLPPHSFVSVDLEVADGLGGFVNCSVIVDIVVSNSPPECAATQQFGISLSAPIGSTVGQLAEATDVDNDNITYIMQSSTPQFAFDSTTRIITTTVSPLTWGTATLVFIADDGRDADRCEVTVIVSDNNGPQCPSPRQEITFSSLSTLNTVIGVVQPATDQDGNALSYSFNVSQSVGNPTDFTFNPSTLEVSIAQTPLGEGDTIMLLMVTDGLVEVPCFVNLLQGGGATQQRLDGYIQFSVRRSILPAQGAAPSKHHRLQSTTRECPECDVVAFLQDHIGGDPAATYSTGLTDTDATATELYDVFGSTINGPSVVDSSNPNFIAELTELFNDAPADLGIGRFTAGQATQFPLCTTDEDCPSFQTQQCQPTLTQGTSQCVCRPQFIPTTTTSCDTCNIGHTRDTGSNNCSPCPPNTYKDTAGNHECTACPQGLSIPEGVTASSAALCTCGNNQVNSNTGEQCEGSAITAQGCSSQLNNQSNPFAQHGTLTCTGCTVNTNNCTSCGNGIREEDEACDTLDFGQETCATHTAKSQGRLVCSNLCTLIDVSLCSECGDGVIEGSESCEVEPEDLNGITCQSLGFVGGQAACSPQSCTVDQTGCATGNSGTVSSVNNTNADNTQAPSSAAGATPIPPIPPPPEGGGGVNKAVAIGVPVGVGVPTAIAVGGIITGVAYATQSCCFKPPDPSDAIQDVIQNQIEGQAKQKARREFFEAQNPGMMAPTNTPQGGYGAGGGGYQDPANWAISQDNKVGNKSGLKKVGSAAFVAEMVLGAVGLDVAGDAVGFAAMANPY